MIIFTEGKSFPIEFQTGDILFIAGRLPCDRSRKLPFEHVVLAAENRQISTANELLDLPVYGMPESQDSATNKVLLSNGWYWKNRSVIGVRLGSATTVWNLAARHPSITLQKAAYLSLLMSFQEGVLKFSYDTNFAVDHTLRKGIKTNCLGFVCSLLEYFKLNVLSRTFPEYESPYSNSPGRRTYPSPGHLAKALTYGTSHPYLAADEREAEWYATVVQTLEDLASQARDISAGD